MTALKGAELLAMVKEMPRASKSDLVRACGYVSTKKDGTERLNFTGFYEGILEAKDVALGVAAGGASKSGRKLSYTATVQFNGNLLVGKAYTALLGLTPGDEFEIRLNPRKKTVRLVPAGSVEDGELDADDQEGEDADQVSDAPPVPPAVAEGVTPPALSEKDLALAAA